jgi:CHC2 zinc finger
MVVEDLINRLHKAKKTGPGKWNARCPAHEDKSPSLSIAEKDGVILLHCFAGCEVADICGAIGVEVKDLFPPKDDNWKPDEKPVRFSGGRFTAVDALRCLRDEGFVIGLLASDMGEGKMLSATEQDRLGVAIGRIATALEYLDANDKFRPEG